MATVVGLVKGRNPFGKVWVHTVNFIGKGIHSPGIFIGPDD